MSTTRAAKYLNGADTGKTITSPTGHTGTIAAVEHTATHTRVRLDQRAADGTHTLLFRSDVEVTITGKPSPAPEDPNTVHVRIEPQLSLGDARTAIRDSERGIVNGRQFIADVARTLGNPDPEVQRILDGYDKSRPQIIGQSGNTGHTTLDAALGTYCGHNGGQGIGAGHTCTCTRTAHHSLDSERPHGCPCGAAWKD